MEKSYKNVQNMNTVFSFYCKFMLLYSSCYLCILFFYNRTSNEHVHDVHGRLSNLHVSDHDARNVFFQAHFCHHGTKTGLFLINVMTDSFFHNTYFSCLCVVLMQKESIANIFCYPL